MYKDDCIIFFSKKGSSISDSLIKSLANDKGSFKFIDEGGLKFYLGVDIKKHKDGTIEATESNLIERFIELVDREKNINVKTTPATKPLLLHKDTNGLERKHTWNYRQTIGMLTYLQGTSRPDIAMATHQAVRFCITPNLSQERVVHRIGRRN